MRTMCSTYKTSRTILYYTATQNSTGCGGQFADSSIQSCTINDLQKRRTGSAWQSTVYTAHRVGRRCQFAYSTSWDSSDRAGSMLYTFVHQHRNLGIAKSWGLCTSPWRAHPIETRWAYLWYLLALLVSHPAEKYIWNRKAGSTLSLYFSSGFFPRDICKIRWEKRTGRNGLSSICAFFSWK